MKTQGFDFFFFWNLTRRNWLYLLIAGIVMAGVFFSVSKFHLKRRYESQFSLYIGKITEEDNLPTAAGSTAASASSTRIRSLSNELALGQMLINDYIRIISSRLVSGQVKAKLTERYPQETNLRYSVRVESREKSRVLDIFVQANDPEIAQFAATVITEVFMQESKKILQVANAAVIDVPTLPLAPCYPNVKKNTFFGFVFGCLIAWGLCFLKAILDTKLYSPDELQEVVAMPLLGMIPLDEELAEKDLQNTDRIVALRSGSSDRRNLGEAFRNLRTNLQYLDVRDGDLGKIFVVTSTLPSEGKTFTCANMAFSLAEVGKKTLLINCDLRKPSLGNTLGLSSGKGLVSVLVGECSFDEAVIHNVRELPLDVLLCGPIPPTPARLLLSDGFKNRLAEWRKQYDYIIIDAPPSLGLADASIIGALADGMILVVQAARTSKENLSRVCEQLKQLNMNLVGVVFNRFSEKSAGYYGVSGYSYGYEYGYTRRPKKWYEKWFPSLFRHRHSRHHSEGKEGGTKA